MINKMIKKEKKDEEFYFISWYEKDLDKQTDGYLDICKWFRCPNKTWSEVEQYLNRIQPYMGLRNQNGDLVISEINIQTMEELNKQIKLCDVDYIDDNLLWFDNKESKIPVKYITLLYNGRYDNSFENFKEWRKHEEQQ